MQILTQNQQIAVMYKRSLQKGELTKEAIP